MYTLIFPGTYQVRRILWLAACFIGLAITPLAAEEQNVSPGINRDYYDAEFEHWVNVFEQSGREVYDKRHEVVSALDLKPGMAVADIGAGTGFYSLLFAKEVGASGRVYAVDISQNFIQNIFVYTYRIFICKIDRLFS